MKRVLITGAKSYVGTNVEKWLSKEPEKYYVETLDMKSPSWREFDFSHFDVVFHVAGIAHVSARKNMKDLYFSVNRDLAIETAIKAKQSGVSQFIFMSSMIVYSSKETRITANTIPNPDNFYGLSKIEAEKGIELLHDKQFRVVILRPPMIYGPNSIGNFTKLVELSKRMIVIPKYKNVRSMLFIDHLCFYVSVIIDNGIGGTFFPQNEYYISTSDILQYYRKLFKRRVYTTKLFNPLITFAKKRINIFNKVFGDFYYDFFDDIISSQLSFEDTLRKTVSEEKQDE